MSKIKKDSSNKNIVIIIFILFGIVPVGLEFYQAFEVFFGDEQDSTTILLPLYAFVALIIVIFLGYHIIIKKYNISRRNTIIAALLCIITACLIVAFSYFNSTKHF